ncbi:hypothetical protein DXV76_09550 [Rhodobacteraceae bacterium CCMM004]|nr:hypothetical protein DXV76_09550 [Rhodobacteraceae bacterium CCMM004]
MLTLAQAALAATLMTGAPAPAAEALHTLSRPREAGGVAALQTIGLAIDPTDADGPEPAAQRGAEATLPMGLAGQATHAMGAAMQAGRAPLEGVAAMAAFTDRRLGARPVFLGAPSAGGMGGMGPQSLPVPMRSGALMAQMGPGLLSSSVAMFQQGPGAMRPAAMMSQRMPAMMRSGGMMRMAAPAVMRMGRALPFAAAAPSGLGQGGGLAALFADTGMMSRAAGQSAEMPRGMGVALPQAVPPEGPVRRQAHRYVWVSDLARMGYAPFGTSGVWGASFGMIRGDEMYLCYAADDPTAAEARGRAIWDELEGGGMGNRMVPSIPMACVRTL